MTFPRISNEMELVFKWTKEANIGLSQSLEALVSFDEIEEIKNRKFKFVFKEFYEMQKNVLKLIEKTLLEGLDDDRYKDIVVLIAGSVARLEYIHGVSDIDTFGLIVAPLGDAATVPPVGEPAALSMADRVKEASSKLKDFNDLKRKLGDKDISLDGVPYYGEEYFGTQNQLFEKLGKFDEPNWAVSYRANVLFESIAFSKDANTLKRFDEIVKKVNQVYSVSADLRQKQFPFLGAILIGFLCRGGVLAGISRFKSHDEGSKDALEERSLEAGIIKILGGRVCCSAVHTIMLHVLYWHGFLKPNGEEDLSPIQINEFLNRTPLYKIVVAIPAIFGVIYENVTKFNSKWSENLHLEKDAKQSIEEAIKQLYVVLISQGSSAESGAGGRRAASRAKASRASLANIYASFLIWSMYTRKRPPKFTSDHYEKLTSHSMTIAKCLVLCEKVTLLLATKGPSKASEQMRYLRIFGTEVFDKVTHREALLRGVSGVES
jgi:hypothetical protein